MTELLDRMRRAKRRARLRAHARSLLGDHAVIRCQRLIAPVSRNNLNWLAWVYETDKGSSHHAYTSLYERHFRALRRRPIKLLEIGIGGEASFTWGGASLRMWRDYFRKGDIHGVDVFPKCIKEPRITTHVGDQADRAFMVRLAAVHGPFDVVIDDGSHVSRGILASFGALFPDHLTPGGIYVIEDMATAYNDKYGGGPPGSDDTSISLAKGLIDEINRESWTSNANPSVAALHVYKEIAFIEKM